MSFHFIYAKNNKWSVSKDLTQKLQDETYKVLVLDQTSQTKLMQI